MGMEDCGHTKSGHEPQAQVRWLAEAFSAAGWNVEKKPRPSPRSRGADLVLGAPSGERYLAGLRFCRQARRDALEGALAAAILEARAEANELGCHPMAIVACEYLSDAMAAHLREYASRVAPDQAWGMVDWRGRWEFRGPEVESVPKAGPPPFMLKRQVAWKVCGQAGQDPFSDLGQWLLKVLLAPRIPEGLLAAPRRPIRNSKQLAEAAGVSLATASRWATALEERGFLRRSRRELELRQLPELLKKWWVAAAARRPADQPAVFQLPHGTLFDQLEEALRRAPERPRACLGLFAACRHLGVGFVEGAPVHLYLEDRSPRALERLGLMAASQGQPASILVRVPAFPEAVFRARVQRDGVPVADIVQCWLDVADHPVRGPEQAAEILRRLDLPAVQVL